MAAQTQAAAHVFKLFIRNPLEVVVISVENLTLDCYSPSRWIIIIISMESWSERIHRILKLNK